MAKSPSNMSVEEIDAELAGHEADNLKDQSAKDALREKMRSRAERTDELAAARVAKVTVENMDEPTRAALAQEVKGAGGVKSTAKAGTPGGS